jgi:hypothetical protein
MVDIITIWRYLYYLSLLVMSSFTNFGIGHSMKIFLET